MVSAAQRKRWLCLALLAAASGALCRMDDWRLYQLVNVPLTAAAVLFCARRARRADRPPVSAGTLLAGALTALSFFYVWDTLLGGAAACVLTALMLPACVFLARGAQGALGAAMGALDASRAVPDAAGKRRVCARVFLCVSLSLCVVWALSFPYQYSYDTIYQWRMLHGAYPYNDIHAIGHTLFLKLLVDAAEAVPLPEAVRALCVRFDVDAFGFVVFAQIALLAGLCAALSAFLTDRGVPAAWQAALFCCLCLSQTAAQACVTPWKDMPYAICLGGVTLEAARWRETPERFSGGRGALRAAALGLLLAAAVLLRQNGIVVLLAMGAYFAAAMARRRLLLQAGAMLASAAVLLAGANAAFYGALGGEHSQTNGAALQVFGSGLAAIVNDPSVTQEELAEIDALVPVEWMREHYPPWEHRQLVWSFDGVETGGSSTGGELPEDHFVTRLGRNGREAILLYFRLMPRHLAACARDVFQNTLSIWGHSPHVAGVFLTDNVSLMTLLLLAATEARRRGRLRASPWAFMPLMLSTASIAVAAISNEARYLAPTSVLFPFLLLYLLSGDRRGEAGRA